MSTQTEWERHDDHCPACGEDIDWDYGHVFLGESYWCDTYRGMVDVAVLDLQHLAAS